MLGKMRPINRRKSEPPPCKSFVQVMQAFCSKPFWKAERLKYKPRTMDCACALGLHLKCVYSEEFLLWQTEEFITMNFYVHYSRLSVPPSLGVRSIVREERANAGSPAQKGRIAGTGTSCSLGIDMNWWFREAKQRLGCSKLLTPGW